MPNVKMQSEHTNTGSETALPARPKCPAQMPKRMPDACIGPDTPGLNATCKHRHSLSSCYSTPRHAMGSQGRGEKPWAAAMAASPSFAGRRSLPSVQCAALGSQHQAAAHNMQRYYTTTGTTAGKASTAQHMDGVQDTCSVLPHSTARHSTEAAPWATSKETGQSGVPVRGAARLAHGPKSCLLRGASDMTARSRKTNAATGAANMQAAVPEHLALLPSHSMQLPAK